MSMIVEYHFFDCHWLNAFAAEANVFGLDVNQVCMNLKRLESMISWVRLRGQCNRCGTWILIWTGRFVRSGCYHSANVMQMFCTLITKRHSTKRNIMAKRVLDDPNWYAVASGIPNVEAFWDYVYLIFSLVFIVCTHVNASIVLFADDSKYKRGITITNRCTWFP